MNTPRSTAALARAIDEIEAEVRMHETRAGELRDLVVRLRALGQISTIARDRQADAPVAQTAGEINRDRRGQLKRQGLCERCAKPVCETSTVLCQRHLDLASNRRLKSERKIHGLNAKVPGGSGITPRRRPTLEHDPEPAAVDAAEPLPEESVPVSVPAAVIVAPAPVEIPKATAHAIVEILKTGASYDVNELIRNLRYKSVDIPGSELTAILEQLARDRRVDRIPLLGKTRYRKRAA